MSLFTLENSEIAVQIDSLGAEQKSLQDVKTKTEYMWGADPQYWKRASPVLFPVVGAYKNNACPYRGKTYHLPQHGFARDMEFSLMSQRPDSICFALTDTEETRRNYPFAFRLEIEYQIAGRTVTVLWRVHNPSEETMYFSIGGHPGFCCPLDGIGQQTDYALSFGGADRIISRLLGPCGVTDQLREYSLTDGLLPIAADLFDQDALIVENHQAQQVSLVDPEGKRYLTVDFDAPLFGVWSPPKKQAPFVCIEPWYGRADHESFAGELNQREWGNALSPGGRFEASYRITV